MKIGMIGAGEVSLAVGRYAIAAGHQVILSNRSGGEKLAAAVAKLGGAAESASIAEAAEADLVLLGVPWRQIEAALGAVPDWKGKILIDATNPFLETGPKWVLADLGDRGATEIVGSFAPGARLVKAFNSVVMRNFEAGPRRGDARRVLCVSGDDLEAKGIVTALIKSFGFAVIDLGGLETGGRLQQAGGPITGRDLLIAHQDR
jgi:predicted dinucleotide-binding enzyme